MTLKIDVPTKSYHSQCVYSSRILAEKKYTLNVRRQEFDIDPVALGNEATQLGKPNQSLGESWRSWIDFLKRMMFWWVSEQRILDGDLFILECLGGCGGYMIPELGWRLETTGWKRQPRKANGPKRPNQNRSFFVLSSRQKTCFLIKAWKYKFKSIQLNGRVNLSQRFSTSEQVTIFKVFASPWHYLLCWNTPVTSPDPMVE